MSTYDENLKSGKANPNSKQFFDRLYGGVWEINNFSTPWDYEEKAENQFYEKLVRLPFFNNCHGKILDVGCGLGGIFSLLSLNHYLAKHGIDFSEVAIAKCSQKI